MTASARCSRCGKELAADGAGTECPRCLLAMALSPEARAGIDAGADSRARKRLESSGGRFFADYELFEEIARGGMGIVHRARQVSLNRPVALKMILAGSLASPAQVQRFHLEAEAAARLDHPGIVPIYEIGEHDGRHFYSMKLIPGGSLARRPRGFSPRRAAELVAKVARAVHYAHQRNVLHRDLKPTNILLDLDGEPHVTDFGLAKLLGVESSLTQTSAALGTPAYMAPEQARGNAAGATVATDIYSLGAVLYDLLTGRPPFLGATPLETMRLVVEEPAVPPQSLNSDVDRDLDTICCKCLEKDATRRYASSEELANDLERWLGGEAIAARPVGSLEHLRRWCRRNPLASSLASGVALLLVALTVGSMVAAARLKDERDRADFEKSVAKESLARTETAERERSEELYRSYLAQSRLRRLSKEANRTQPLSSAVALLGKDRLKPEQVFELRNELIACLAIPDLLEREGKKMGIDQDLAGVSFDSRLERCAYVEKNGAFALHRVESDELLQRVELPDEPEFWYTTSGFSPDDRFLFATYSGYRSVNRVVAWDLEKSKIVVDSPSLGEADVSGNPPVLAATLTEGSIGLFPLEPGRTLRPIAGGKGRAAVKLDREARLLASSRDKKLHVHVIATGQEVGSWEIESNVYSLAWAPDSSWLAAGCKDHRVRIYASPSGERRAVLEGHENAVTRIELSPDGNLLCTGSWDNSARLWDRVSGREQVRLSRATLFRFSQDGLALGMQRVNTLARCDVTGASLLRLLEPASALRPDAAEEVLVHEADWSSDGRWLASTSREGIHVWNVLTGHLAADIPFAQPGAVRFDPAGKWLAGFGEDGIELWPWEEPTEAGAPVRVGPASAVAPGIRSSWRRLALDASGQLMAWTETSISNGVLVSMSKLEERRLLAGCYRIFSIALSPDGRLAAAAAWKDPEVTVWDVERAEIVARLSAAHDGEIVFAYSVAFTPDSRWVLVGSSRDYKWWRTDDWKPGLEVARNAEFGYAPFAIDRHGRLAALTIEARSIALVDMQSGRQLAVLTPPNPEVIGWIGFSPEGGRLAAVTQVGRVQVWDLRGLRKELERWALADGLPEFSPPPASGPGRVDARAALAEPEEK